MLTKSTFIKAIELMMVFQDEGRNTVKSGRRPDRFQRYEVKSKLGWTRGLLWYNRK